MSPSNQVLTGEAGYNIFYNVRLSLSSSTKIIKSFYCILFSFKHRKKKKILQTSLHDRVLCFITAAWGKLFHLSNLESFLVAQLEPVLTQYGQTVSHCPLYRDTESPVLAEACQSHLRGAPGYITPVSLTSPLRSYFSNVQSSLWLLCLPSPSSSH